MITRVLTLALSILLAACAGAPARHPPSPIVVSLEPASRGPLAQLEADALRDSGPEVSALRLLEKNQDGLAMRLLLADTATSSLDLQYYFWWADDSGLLLLKKVLEAADRGVRVRLILDDLLVIGGDNALAALEAHPNVEIRLFNAWARRSLLGRAMEGIGEFTRVNHRMHNKLMVADNHVAILGGRNIGNEYFGLKERFNFHDLDVFGVGPVARQGSVLFDSFWNSPWITPVAAITKPARPEDLALVRRKIDAGLSKSDKLAEFPLAPSPWDSELAALRSQLLPGRTRVIYDDVSGELIQRNMVPWMDRLFQATKHEALVTNPYIIVTDNEIAGVARMRGSGIRLRVLTNSLESNDVPAVNSHYKKWRKPLVQAGAELYELRADANIRALTDTPPVTAKFAGLHTKATVVDSRYVFVGSMNFDPRSAHWNTEMGVLIDSVPIAEQVAALMNRDMQPDRSWKVEVDGAGSLSWTSDKGKLTSQPAQSFWQRIEDVLFGLAPENLY